MSSHADPLIRALVDDSHAPDVPTLRADCLAHIDYLMSTHDIDEHAALVCFEEGADVTVNAMHDFLYPPHLSMKAMRRRLRRYLDRTADRRAHMEEDG